MNLVPSTEPRPDLIPDRSPISRQPIEWPRKVRWALGFRLRQVRLNGHQATRPELIRDLGWDPARLSTDGQQAMAGGCPTCGRDVEAWRVQLRLLDPLGPPTYANARWAVRRCAACARRT